jgi:Plavaka transposase
LSDEKKEMTVHDIQCFTWSHPHTNIYTTMMPDMLHQLLKGILQYLIDWIKVHTSTTITRKRKRDSDGKIALQDAGVSDQLDHRFRSVPQYPCLKVFSNFSCVKQWTGVEQKAIARQLVPVIAPLLLNGPDKAMIVYARAVIDFWILAQYRSHDDNTLKYMEHAISQMDKLKWAFRKYRHDGHFNFPKFHVITHYPEFIRMYRTTEGVDTSNTEAAHKYLIKEHFSRTNKHDDFQEQIIRHLTRRTNAIAMEELVLYSHTAPRTNTDDQLESKVTQPSRPLNLVRYGWKTKIPKVPDDKITAGEFDRVIKLDGFLDALAVFVRESRNKNDGKTTPPHLIDRREPDASWVKPFIIQIHGSIACWKPDGKDSQDVQKLTEDLVRCIPNWHGKELWRRDYVWVQEYTEEITCGSILGGRRLGELLLLVSIHDPERWKAVADDKRPGGFSRKNRRFIPGHLSISFKF